ncbi:MAG: Ig-like domain-containing protein, partial [Lachnospiraceae bacterium]|nr:Ig-like domain-containing protein [Lachnospiraceae bacterium]
MKVRRKWAAGMMILVLLLGTLSVPKGAEAASRKVKVKKITSVSSITDSKTIYLAKGKTVKLKTTVTVTPDKPENRKVTYKSSDKKIATVTGKGVIKGKKAGNAKITVTSKKDSKKKATVKVKVVKGKVTGIQLNKTSATLTVGDTVKLKADVKTSRGGRKDVAWTSSKEKVATVNKGTVTAVGAGETTITVKAADGSGKKAACKVMVKKPETPEKPNPEVPTHVEKNASDVAALQAIIKEQKSLGAYVPTDLDASAYTWDEKNGRLTGINWPTCKLQKTLSFEGLTALTDLDCYSNQLSKLDVSKNTLLERLSCGSNQLTKLDVSKNTALTELNCFGNQLTELDVSGCTELTQL